LIILEQNLQESNSFTQGRKKSVVLINSANIVDQADIQLLPAVYSSLEQDMGFDPVQTGLITAVRSLLQSLTNPVWGYYGDIFSRKILLTMGCFIWAFFTFLVAFATTFETMLIFRALSGIGLAVLYPTASSLLSDYYPENSRGKAFGLLGLTGIMGAVIGTLYATSIADDTIHGMPGWRFAFVSMAVVSFILGALIYLFGKDPLRGNSEEQLTGLINEKTEKAYKISKSDISKIMTNKTFVLIVLQGMAGLIPWSSILFIIAWFEYIGFEGPLAAVSFAVIAMGAAFGNLLGGILGDKAAKWNPEKGRIIVAQISVFSGIPMMFVIFLFIPRSTDMLLVFILAGFITGMLISWAATACNSPIFSELFEPEIRSTAFAIDRLFEGAVAASGTLIVGWLAVTFFDYITPAIHTAIEDLPRNVRITNINAMANAMLIATVVPWIVCFFIYFFVYKTYPKDRERRNDVLKMRKIELEELKTI
jgi:MFS family permease